MADNPFRNIADEILAERAGKKTFRNFPIASLNEAYGVQDEMAQRICETRSTRVGGYKVGLTNPVSQKSLDSATPVAGRIFADRVYPIGTELRASEFGNLILELELGLRIARDLDAKGAPFVAADLLDVIDAMAPAVECVDNRHADPRSANLHSMIADNAWGAAAIVGSFRKVDSDIGALKGEVWRNGIHAASATSAEVMGNPISSAVWLANHLASQERILKSGDIVMTGAIINLGAVAPGDVLRFSLGDAEEFDVAVLN